MSIHLLSSPGLWSAASSRPVARQPAAQDNNIQETTAKAVGTTPDSALSARQNMPGGQNIPGVLSDDTRAALLSLQEAESASASAAPSGQTGPVLADQDMAAGRLVTSLKATAVSDLPADRSQTFIAGLDNMLDAASRSGQEMIPPGALTSHPALQTYATVTVGGKVVATIDNQGVVTAADAVTSRFANGIANEVNGSNGPDLAQLRAQQIAALLGGQVVRSSTAMTQMQFNANPVDPYGLRSPINAEAMMQNPLYRQLQDIKTRLA